MYRQQVSNGTIAATGTVAALRHGYTGRLHDATTGLTEYRHRWMNPTAGTFLQRDPIATEYRLEEEYRKLPFMQQTRSVTHLYEYVSSNSYKYIDPMGLYAGRPDWEWGPIFVPSRGNCYRFACDDPISYFPDPLKVPWRRHYSPIPEPHSVNPGNIIIITSCEDLRKGALLDGLSEPLMCTGECPVGTTKVAYGISETTIDKIFPEYDLAPGQYDHHWWRLTPDGWKEKRGYFPVRDIGSDPGDPGADTGIYKFCGYLCVPDGVDLDAKKGDN